MKRKVILTIVVPFYNSGKYLKECLDSLLSQDISASKYEIILVDDGSTDNSGQIADKFKNTNEEIIVLHNSRGGVSSARNSGIESSHGEYIWFVDSDDLIAQNVLSEICDILCEKKPDELFVGVTDFQDGEDVLNLIRIPHKAGTSVFYGDWLWSRIIKKQVIIDSGIRFNPNVQLAEDHFFCSMLNPHIRTIVHYEVVTYFYRHRANSLSTTLVKNKLDTILESAKEFLKASFDGRIEHTTAMNQVCEFMTDVMAYVATLSRDEEKKILHRLKNDGLFPLPVQDSFSLSPAQIGQNDYDNQKLYELKKLSYTKKGYRKLRIFRKWLKIKRKLLHFLNL